MSSDVTYYSNVHSISELWLQLFAYTLQNKDVEAIKENHLM